MTTESHCLLEIIAIFDIRPPCLAFWLIDQLFASLFEAKPASTIVPYTSITLAFFRRAPNQTYFVDHVAHSQDG